MGNLSNKNIILTGASSGIGYEMLQILQGYDNIKIIAAARNIENIKDIPQKVYPFSVDISTQDGVDKLFEYADSTFGEVDVFIANAGLTYIEKADNPDWQHNEYIYKVNVFSPIYALQKLISIKSEKQKIFASTISAGALASLPAYALYCSTKAALHYFIETYRYEQGQNIQITSVYPVATKTDFFDKATQQEDFKLPFPTQSAKTVARKIIKGIEKGKKRIYPSILYRLSYPIGRAFPIFLKAYSLAERRKVENIIK